MGLAWNRLAIGTPLNERKETAPGFAAGIKVNSLKPALKSWIRGNSPDHHSIRDDRLLLVEIVSILS